MAKYTFTFEKAAERKFREVLNRLEPDEYTIIEDVNVVDETNTRYSELQAIYEMDPEACLTFRLGMGNHIKIRRERTEEELAKEKEIEERTTITIHVQVPMDENGVPIAGPIVPKV
jgi:hypothetical protein